MNLRVDIGFYICLISVSVKYCSAMDILEFLLGPRLGRTTATSKSLRRLAAQDLAEGLGYPFEAHQVLSQSGYVLSLHRIPHGIKRRQANDTKKPVALFQHGLASASDMWMYQAPNMDLRLPYALAEAGYDVWLSNMRGNVYSNEHKTLNPERDPKYWDFSLHEVSYYDVPAVIDYVLNETNQSNVYFMGHSIGSTVGMILCSLRPEYNAKIRLHLALAPLISVAHDISVPHRLMLLPSIPLIQTALTNQIYNLFPRRPYFTRLIQMLCQDGMPMQQLCLSMLFLFVGTDYEQFDTEYFPSMSAYFPAGASTYLVQHALQIYLNGTLSALDYGDTTLNYEKYNQTVPPSYDLSKVTHPVSLHYGIGDLFVTSGDIESIENKLPNPVGKFPVPYRNFNHIDFVWGIDARKLLYDRLIVIMDKYR